MRKLIFAIGALAASCTTALAADPTGEWLVDGGYARVRIDNCGGKMWGIVAWEKTPGGVDKNNPDASKRDRPTLGLPILLAMAPNKDRWEGEIYNTQDGRTYTANISLVNDDVLKVQGCVLGFLCGGQEWTRYKAQTTAHAGSTGATRSVTASKPSTAGTTGSIGSRPGRQAAANASPVCQAAAALETTGSVTANKRW